MALSFSPKLESQSAEPAPGLTEFDLGYYGWRVVLAACLGVMAGFGSLFVYTFAVFVKPLSAQFGWSREATSLGFGLAAATLGLISPLLGRWIDRFGPRRIILPCMTVFSCAIASLALLRSELWQFYVACIVLGLVGNGAAHLAYSRSISTWFQRRLGTALAFVMGHTNSTTFRRTLKQHYPDRFRYRKVEKKSVETCGDAAPYRPPGLCARFDAYFAAAICSMTRAWEPPRS